MFESLMLFLVPANASQATQISPPPAVVRPAKPLVQRWSQLRFGASVLGNSIGCGAIFAACWFSIQLMQVLMVP